MDEATLDTEVSTGELAEALGCTPQTVTRAVRAKDVRFCEGLRRTPGGLARWPLEDAARIVEAHGRPVPEPWQRQSEARAKVRVRKR